MISVVIPVGPFEGNKRWLRDAFESVWFQTVKPMEILLINDMASLAPSEIADWLTDLKFTGFPRGLVWFDDSGHHIRVWNSPWRLGVAHAFNFGVALARHDLVFMLGSDDYLEPACLERCIQTWEAAEKQDGYYYVSVKYLDDRPDPIQTLPCGAAMVTKGAWRKTGGFAVESAVGTSDANFISQMLVHKAIPLIPVAEGEPLYAYRTHPETDTASKGAWQGVILETRNLLTKQWQPPNWGRLE